MKTVIETRDRSTPPAPDQVVPHTALVFLCPSCESALEYQGSHLEDPSAPTALTDYFRCPVGCGTFEYERQRHHLRLLDCGYATGHAC
jgi:hypothetical protein